MSCISTGKNMWSETEDIQLEHLYNLMKNEVDIKCIWNEIAKYLPSRSNEQCRKRWRYKFDPTKNRDKWSREEDLKLVSLHSEFGNKWSKIGKLLNNRPDIEVKNRFFSLKRKSINEELEVNDDLYQNNLERYPPEFDSQKPFKMATTTFEHHDSNCSYVIPRNFETNSTNIIFENYEAKSEDKENIKPNSQDDTVLNDVSHMHYDTQGTTSHEKRLNCSSCYDYDIFQLLSAEYEQSLPVDASVSEKLNANSLNIGLECPATCAITKFKKNVWSETEDEQLIYYYNFYKEKNGLKSIWNEIAKHFSSRSNEQCRKRWRYKLDPTIKIDEWTRKDDVTLINMYKKLGKKWAIIGKLMDNRSDIEVKNRFLVLERQNKKLNKLRDVPLLNLQPTSNELSFNSIMFSDVEFNMSAPTNGTDMIPHFFDNSMDLIRPSSLVIPRVVTSPLVRLGLY